MFKRDTTNTSISMTNGKIGYLPSLFISSFFVKLSPKPEKEINVYKGESASQSRLGYSFSVTSLSQSGKGLNLYWVDDTSSTLMSVN